LASVDFGRSDGVNRLIGDQAKLDAARQRLHEIVILTMETWLLPETLRGLREAEDWRRERVRFHFEVLKRFREEERRRRAERHFTP
jgi:hypothetical protein